MKIYFESGKLDSSKFIDELWSKAMTPLFITLDATEGVESNIKTLELSKKENYNGIIYTNSIFAFHNRYAWNDVLKVPEVYIRAGENNEFTRIDKLTDRELREAHRIDMMYLSGAFGVNFY